MTQMSAELKKMRDSWKAAKEEAKDLSGLTFPDGVYEVQVVSADLGYSKAGRFQAHFEYRITEGEYEGKSIHSYEGLKTPTNLAYFLNKIGRFGYDANALTPDDLPEVLEGIASDQREVTLTVVTKNGFQNKYIKDVYGEPSGTVEAETEEESEAEVNYKETTSNAPFGDDLVLALGMEVQYTYRNKSYLAKVIEIDAEKGLAKCNPVGTSTLHVVKVDELNIMEQETD